MYARMDISAKNFLRLYFHLKIVSLLDLNPATEHVFMRILKYPGP